MKNIFLSYVHPPEHNEAVSLNFDILASESSTVVTNPCRMPNSLVIPIFKSMKKNRTAHTGAPGKLKIASAKAINASPVP